jgi:hypothetical protein
VRTSITVSAFMPTQTLPLRTSNRHTSKCIAGRKVGLKVIEKCLSGHLSISESTDKQNILQLMIDESLLPGIVGKVFLPLRIICKLTGVTLQLTLSVWCSWTDGNRYIRWLRCVSCPWARHRAEHEVVCKTSRRRVQARHEPLLDPRRSEHQEETVEEEAKPQGRA